MGLPLPSGEEYQIVEDKDNADSDGGIGKIEHRPGTNVDKIGDLPAEGSIYEVANRTAQDEPESYLGHHPVKQGVMGIKEDGGNASQSSDHDEEALIAEDAKSAPDIGNIFDLERSLIWYRLPQRHVGSNQNLAHLV